MSCVRGCCVDAKTHYKSVRLSGPSPRREQDRRAARDMDAYARLRANGVQPKSIDGAAELERFASTTHEVEHKNIITDGALRRKVTNLFEQAPPPSTTPIGPDHAA